MFCQPGKQFFKMLLMMVIRSHENEGERVAIKEADGHANWLQFNVFMTSGSLENE